MPNKRYLSGRRAEQMLKRLLEGQGMHVTRSAGSKGKFDLIAVEPDSSERVRLIQLKSLKTHSERALVPLVRAWNENLMAPSAHYQQQLYVRQSGLWILYLDNRRPHGVRTDY